MKTKIVTATGEHIATRNESKRDKHAASRTAFRVAASKYQSHSFEDDEDDYFDSLPSIERMR